MRSNFRETLPQKTDQELRTISKDTAFYSDDERFYALQELETRGDLSAELASEKKILDEIVNAYPRLDSAPARQIYKKSMMWLGSMLGGPLAVGYIIAENFKAFNEPERAKKTWIYAIATTILIFVGLYFIPEEVLDRIPNILIPLIYTVIADRLMYKYQDANIGTHFISKGCAFSWWRVIAIGLIGLAITLAFIVCIAICDIIAGSDPPMW